MARRILDSNESALPVYIWNEMNPYYWTVPTLCINFSLGNESDHLTMRKFARVVGLCCSNMEPSWSAFLIPSENNTLLKNVEIDFFFFPVVLATKMLLERIFGQRRTSFGHH